MSLRTRVSSFVAFASLATALPATAQTSFITFESGPVRPLAMSPGGSRLFVANTPDNRLEIYAIDGQGLRHTDSVPVGMEPVAVAARSDGEVWVVNHLSDSVSVVSVTSGGIGSVARTLLVGDEPRDVVFAGPGGNRAFITTAHRGQHRTHPSISAVPGAGDPQLTTAGVGRADVWVFDASALGSSIGGTPLKIVELFADTPRALAVSSDGGTVYAAAFHSGNQTTVVSEGMVCDGFGTSTCAGDSVGSPNGLGGGRLPGGNPGPSVNIDGDNAPETGLIVKYQNPPVSEWQDELGRNWSNGVRFFLPDLDVFAIDATTLNETGNFAHVGTILFNMVVNPVNGNVYVSNTDAQNLTRFEGPGVFAPTTVQGNLAQSRITVLTGSDVKPRHLNRHIDYSVLPAPAGVRDHSLATPLQMVVSSDGAKLYVAAFGSSKVGVFDTADLEDDSLWDDLGAEFDPTVESANYISLSGGGPSGLVLDEVRNRLYVATRFNNGVSIVDLGTGTERANLVVHNPEPEQVVEGRHMLYDAFKTSSNGEASCSSCHIFGDFDSLAWDLGNPDAAVSNNPQPINFETVLPLLGIDTSGLNGTGNIRDFHPMKGPMTTQTLRGMVNSGHMHWRGDRANGFFGIDDPHSNDSRLSFKNFIVAFEGLVGSELPPTDPGLQADMDLFADFALEITLPPNPIRSLDNSLTTSQQGGRDFFNGSTGQISDGSSQFPGLTGFFCDGCHVRDGAAGFFGTGGDASFEGETQIFKIPHLRNLYQKVGMFGMPDVPFNNPGDNAHKGDQVRGTGFLHDGSTDTLFRFFQAILFNNPGVVNGEADVGFDGGDPQRRDMEQFMLAFNTDLAPIVGQQVTLTGAGNADVNDRVDLMVQGAGATFRSGILGGIVTRCDLVVKGRIGSEQRSWLYDSVSGLFESDRSSEMAIDLLTLKALANTAGQDLTFTCVPPGSGVRMGLDRDEDGVFDSDERDDGTQPGNPASFFGACNNGSDDDGDGLMDLNDPGCRDSGWNIENPECNDGVDNEGDGSIDLADPHCAASWDKVERKPRKVCGLGPEAGILIGVLVGARRRARRGRSLI
jgi:DNA-binding beta-propeller fold protein YncE